MHRYFSRTFLLLGLVALLVQARDFPLNAKRAQLVVAQFPFVQLNAKTRQLAPGARIWNTDNLIQVPSSFYGQKMVVNYTEDFQGEIDRVWVLTPEEAKQPAPDKNKPAK